MVATSSTELGQVLQLEQEAHQRRRRAGVEVGQRCPEPEPGKEQQLLVFLLNQKRILEKVDTQRKHH